MQFAPIKNNTIFYLIPKCQKFCKLLKERFNSIFVLVYFDFDKECILETNSSDTISAGILSYYRKDGLLHFVAFFSCKHPTQEINYEIYDKELLAIIKSFKKWRPILEEAGLPIKILTDYKNLQ